MKTPELRLEGKVASVTATVVGITLGPDSMDGKPHGTITGVTISGTGLTGLAVAVGDPVTVQVNG